MRLLILAIAVTTALCLTTFALGRAMDVEAENRVIFTRDGVTFDCERRAYERGDVLSFEDGSSMHISEDGEVAYTNCHTVP